MDQTQWSMASTPSGAAGAQIHGYERHTGKRFLEQDSYHCLGPVSFESRSCCWTVTIEAQHRL